MAIKFRRRKKEGDLRELLEPSVFWREIDETIDKIYSQRRVPALEWQPLRMGFEMDEAAEDGGAGVYRLAGVGSYVDDEGKLQKTEWGEYNMELGYRHNLEGLFELADAYWMGLVIERMIQIGKYNLTSEQAEECLEIFRNLRHSVLAWPFVDFIIDDDKEFYLVASNLIDQDNAFEIGESFRKKSRWEDNRLRVIEILRPSGTWWEWLVAKAAVMKVQICADPESPRNRNGFDKRDQIQRYERDQWEKKRMAILLANEVGRSSLPDDKKEILVRYLFGPAFLSREELVGAFGEQVVTRAYED